MSPVAARPVPASAAPAGVPAGAAAFLAPLQPALLAAAFAQPGAEVQAVQATGSTNNDLLQRAREAAPVAPWLRCALEQTAGRGRLGRRWFAAPGSAFLFSVALPLVQATPPVGVTLAVGLALAERLQLQIEGLGVAPGADALQLKWPNDLLRRGAKCGGILIERRRAPGAKRLIERVVIGVGLNLLRPEDAQGLIGLPATGVFDRPDDLPDRAHLLERLAHAILATEQRHRLEGFAPWVEAWRGLDAWIGRPVQVSDAGRLLAWGVHRGVAPDGSLLLESEGSERRIVAGDVSLRESRAADPLAPALTVGHA